MREAVKVAEFIGVVARCDEHGAARVAVLCNEWRRNG